MSTSNLSKIVDKDRNSIQTALQSAIVALNDWMCIYAPEMCDESRVKDAYNRVYEGGTLYYIATVVEQCNNALKEENDQNRN